MRSPAANLHVLDRALGDQQMMALHLGAPSIFRPLIEFLPELLVRVHDKIVRCAARLRRVIHWRNAGSTTTRATFQAATVLPHLRL